MKKIFFYPNPRYFCIVYSVDYLNSTYALFIHQIMLVMLVIRVSVSAEGNNIFFSHAIKKNIISPWLWEYMIFLSRIGLQDYLIPCIHVCQFF